MLAVISGSGLDQGLGAAGAAEPVETPYGMSSGTPVRVPAVVPAGRAGAEYLFLARHGAGHRLAPHRINYRANLWALREAGAERVVAVNSVGSLRPGWGPGVYVLPDQLIDYTWGREQSFAGPDEPVVHLDFSRPYSPALRERLLAAAAGAGIELVDGAVYGCTQGPRFETPAEIVRMAGDGCDLVGMTGMPEAILARELRLAYASVCVVANLAAGLAGPEQTLGQAEVEAGAAAAMSALPALLAPLA